jgi:hypothetical protein
MPPPRRPVTRSNPTGSSCITTNSNRRRTQTGVPTNVDTVCKYSLLSFLSIYLCKLFRLNHF